MSPYQPSSPCLEQGCFELAVRAGRCARCLLLHKPGGQLYRPAPIREGRESARERGYGRLWERRRRRHLAIEPTCRVCADGQLGNELDHVIPHRGEQWLFDLEGGLQTLCKHHHSQKSNRERSIPIGMMYPLDLPRPPHARPTRLICGPAVGFRSLEPYPDVGAIFIDETDLKRRNRHLADVLKHPGPAECVLIVPAPRTAERAFWSHVMDCEADLQLPIHNAIENHPAEWWDEYMIDQRAEEAMEART